MRQEAERRKRLEEEKRNVAAQNERKAKLEQVKKDMYALFGLTDPQERGKQLEAFSIGCSRPRVFLCVRPRESSQPARVSSSKSMV